MNERRQRKFIHREKNSNWEVDLFSRTRLFFFQETFSFKVNFVYNFQFSFSAIINQLNSFLVYIFQVSDDYHDHISRRW